MSAEIAQMWQIITITSACPKLEVEVLSGLFCGIFLTTLMFDLNSLFKRNHFLYSCFGQYVLWGQCTNKTDATVSIYNCGSNI